ncbi:MAG: ferredoxin--NADP reductase [Planctomycetes bacterium]|nr:ferredoxin--NADP reductase [Planctomycetota bacterium]
MESELNATVLARELVSETVFLLRVKPDESDPPRFLPGQFVQAGVPIQTLAKDGSGVMRLRLQKRSYSLASAPGDPKGYELCLALVDQGRLTPALHKLEAGARLYLDTRPLGRFTLEGLPPERDLVLVATGTGVAPYVAMRRAYAGKSRWRRMVIVHGVRQVADLVYRKELEEAARKDPAFVYLPIVSREKDPARWSGLAGRVHQMLEAKRMKELAQLEFTPKSASVLLCGNPAMIDEARTLLESRGFALDTPERIGGLRFERYW